MSPVNPAPPLLVPPRTIVLVGLMGAGKSAIGRRLAQKLHLPFVDADQEIERAAGCTILSTETGIPREGEAGPSFKNILRAGFVIVYSRPNLHLQR